MLACLLTRFGNLLFPCVLLIVKEIVTGCMGIAVIRRTGKVLAAEWHGKPTTFLLYTLMLVHVVFYNIAPALSDTLIIICTAMMCFSFLMYMMRNIRALKSVGKKTEKKQEIGGQDIAITRCDQTFLRHSDRNFDKGKDVF